MFAAGHGEAGNDLPLLLSTTKAERVDGGWEITGHKIFGSLSPVWTYLGLHAMDTSDPANPQIVHAFLDRDAPRYRIEETWDTLGMRATMSNDTDPRPHVHPGRGSHAGVPGRLRRRRPVPGRHSSRGRLLGLRRRLRGHRPSGLRRRRSTPHARAHVDRADPLDGVPPGRAALRRRDAHQPRGAWTPTSTGSCDDWSNGVDHGMEWPLKIVAAQVRHREPGVVGRRHGPRPHRWLGHLQAQPVRAAVPRRPPRAHPPRQLAAHP